LPFRLSLFPGRLFHRFFFLSFVRPTIEVSGLFLYSCSLQSFPTPYSFGLMPKYLFPPLFPLLTSRVFLSLLSFRRSIFLRRELERFLRRLQLMFSPDYSPGIPRLSILARFPIFFFNSLCPNRGLDLRARSLRPAT